jgi:hypothetical protein
MTELMVGNMKALFASLLATRRERRVIQGPIVSLDAPARSLRVPRKPKRTEATRERKTSPNRLDLRGLGQKPDLKPKTKAIGQGE